MDPPSSQLVQRLTALGLGTSRDLRRCRPRVRRLARDLPTFDTVWIDALVQDRRLTTFQASVLGSAHPDSLTVGRYVLIDRIGSDRQFTHYRARSRDDRRQRVLTIVEQPAESQAAAGRLQILVERLRAATDAGVGRIEAFTADADRVIIVGPWVEGPTLQELLVRRGRFPPDVVLALMRQLVSALCDLERCGVVHGDLRLRNVRLTSRGTPILMRPGLFPALWPELTIHSELPPDCFDTVAPELIDTGRPATNRSDMYALGCMAWELLAGRPPFPHGDPLAKLAAHQTRRIPDVRIWSPDTPPPLAELILRLTSADPLQRPAGFDQLRSAWRGSRAASRRRLSRFVSTFGEPAGPHRPAEQERPPRALQKTAAAALLLLCAIGLLHNGARTELLHIAQSVSQRLQHQEPAPAVNDAPAEGSEFQQIGRPDADGVILLEEEQVYAATEIAAVGPLTIRCSGAQPAVIVVRDSPLRLWAERVVLDNIVLRGPGVPAETSRHAPPALLIVDAQDLAMRRCRFVTDEAGREAALVWSPLDPASAVPQRLLVRDTLFAGHAPTLALPVPPTSVELDNVLKLGPGPLLQVGSNGPGASRRLRLAARHVTLRDAGAFVRCSVVEAAPCIIDVTLTDCALDLAATAALLEFDAGTLPDDWHTYIRITGEGSILRPDTMIAGLRESSSGLIHELGADQLSIEGLQLAEFAFAGVDELLPESSRVEGNLGYRRSVEPPGIIPERLPRPGPDPYNWAEATAAQATRRSRR